MSKVSVLIALGFTALSVAAARPAQAATYTGDCFICETINSGSEHGDVCAARDGDGDGLECRDHCLGWDPAGLCTNSICGITMPQPCNRLSSGPGGGSAGGIGGDTCGRDPQTGVCPASCFSCGPVTGSGGIRV